MTQRVLVIGLARAGTSMAIALAKSGAKVQVVDQKAADQLSMLQDMDRIEALGVEVTTSWTGKVDWSDIDLVAPSPGVPPNHPTLMEARNRGKAIWGELEIAQQLTKAPIFAITGTNGKSTVTALTWWILHHCGKEAVLCGNIAGSGFEETPISTAAERSAPDQILIAEVSSYQLEYTESFKPKASTITNIKEDHLGRHGTPEAYAAAKRRIFRNIDENDVVVFNSDQPETDPRPTLARILQFSESDTNALFEGRINESTLWCKGKHNVSNAMSAWLFARFAGCKDDEIENALRSFPGLQNRMESLGEANGIRFINNTMCTNPEALRASVEAADGPILLIAGGILDNDDLSPLKMIDFAKVKKSFLIGRDRKRLLAHFPEGTELREDLASAFNAAIEHSSRGEVVMLSPGCKSFDQFGDFIARGNSFRNLVQKYKETQSGNG